MADLAVGLAKTVLEGALTRVQSAIEEESKLRQSAQRDLVFITGEFEMMHSFLEVANAERVRNGVVRTWVRQVRDLAYDVEDCIEFVIHLDGGNTSWRRVLPSWICFCVAAAATPPPLDVAVAEIQQLKARVEDVSSRNSRYNLISDSGSNPAGDSASSAAVAATAVDLPGEVRDTVKKQPGFSDLTQLIAKDGKELGVISVWGRSDDLGAMSVIRKAYEDPEVRDTFGCRGWVKLEYPFNRRKFLQSVVAQFYTNSCLEKEKSVDVVELERMENAVVKQGGFVQEFQAQVNEKRYLLVLENVCTMGDWDAIRACLPKSVNGNRIIVSTEELEIAKLCIGHSYRVLELKQYSADHPVCVFFKQGSQGEIDRAISSEEIPNVNKRVYSRIHTTQREAARTWMQDFTLVGREAQMQDLRDYQTKTRFENWRVMSVWGIAGVGKSVLVKNFYYENMHKSSPLFDKYGWVNVVHPLNLMDFSRNLLSDVHSEHLEASEIKDPIQKCRNLLKEHRCLLVINALQSTEEWDSIKSSLVSRQSQSVIIVITTHENIATYCADNEEIVYNVKGLGAEAAFDLFKHKVLLKNPSSALKDSRYRDIEQLILKCGGLPKVIIAVAEFLAPKTVTCMKSKKTMDEKFMPELESNPEFGCLRGLFEWMQFFFRSCPDFLRPCIFYLSIFPGYQIIRRRRLVMRWVAEGYSRDTKDNTAEERGEMLFSMLVNLSMIQPPQCTVITPMRMVQCQVSAFFHEYIMSRPEEENIVFALEVFELKGPCRPSTQRTGRHLVIQKCWDRDRIVFDSIDFSRLRSLTVFGKWESFFVSESMKVLRVLDLEDASGLTDKDLEVIVKQLPRLKFLSLRGRCEISRLPNSLGDLRQLETLDVRGTSIVTLPASITKLKKLQYVRAGATSLADEQPKSCASRSWFPILCRSRQLGVEVPSGIDKLTALHTLGVVNASIRPCKATLKELKKLTQLRKLGVSGINKKNCKEFSEAISCHVHLESLSLWLSKGDQSCLEKMSSPKKLQTLKMYGLVNVVPLWIKHLDKLTKLELEMTISQQHGINGILGEIKELTILHLCINPLQDGGGKLDFSVWLNGCEKSCYLKVKILEVACTSNNLNVAFGSQTMQNLELLKVRCSSASTLKFFELKSLSKLKEVQLIGSQDGVLKEDLEKQLNEHPGSPALKLDESSSSS